MCLSIPSRVVKIKENIATVDTMGVQREVSLDLISDDIKLDDYLLIHVGFAMNKIDKEDALKTLALYQEMLEAMDEEERRKTITDDDSCSKDG